MDLSRFNTDDFKCFIYDIKMISGQIDFIFISLPYDVTVLEKVRPTLAEQSRFNGILLRLGHKAAVGHNGALWHSVHYSCISL